MDQVMGAVVSPPTLAQSFTGRGARRWYLGCLLSCVWIVISGAAVFQEHRDATSRILGIAFLVVYAIAFAVIPPINWTLPHRYRLILPLLLLALSLAALPLLGWGLYSLWAYVGVAAAMSRIRRPVMIVFAIALSLVAALLAKADGATGETLVTIPTIIGLITLMMSSFARQIETVAQLRATQEQMAKLAVEQERGRVARDMHDILGHSLTVITVKTELAGRLLETDQARAAQEIAAVEELARGALADVRSTISGYRGVSILSELANARTALEAAGISADLPTSVDIVPTGRRELFGWVVREGITNVVRHSQATSCRVRLGKSFVEVVDDGRGPGEASMSGNGLVGLTERAQASGARLSIGRAPGGGFALKASL